MPLTGLIRDYDFYPPDDVRVFPMPGTAVRRLDHDAVVADVRYGDVIVHHTFGWAVRAQEPSSSLEAPPVVVRRGSRERRRRRWRTKSGRRP